jgi:hypothetical protein
MELKKCFGQYAGQHCAHATVLLHCITGPGRKRSIGEKKRSKWGGQNKGNWDSRQNVRALIKKSD